MTPPRRTSFSTASPFTLAALAAGALLGLVGCVTDASEEELSVERSEGPLLATPGTAAFGRLRAGSSGELSVELANGGRSDIIVRQVSLIPPDPYNPAYVPAEPCLPPDPYNNPLGSIPPDPYHNPPGLIPPASYLTTRLIAPCVKPGGSTTLSLGFAARDAGGFAAGVRLDYATADGGAFTLTVPATACAVR